MLSFPLVWQEIAFFLVEEWGQFDSIIAITPPLSKDDTERFRRELEIDGSYFYLFDMTPEIAQNLTSWLHGILPSLWGKNQDITRMTMLFRCPSDCDLNAEHAMYADLGRQFPFPFVFLFSPEEDWQSWRKRNDFLFVDEHECLQVL